MASDGREGGYIKAARQWESSPVTRSLSAEGEVVWLRLLFAANWKDSEVMLRTGLRTIKRGQALISEATLAQRARVGRQVVRTALRTLSLHGTITCEEVQPLGNPRARLITILNYDRFQGQDEEPTQGSTAGQPAANQRPTRSEEVEEVKKEERPPEGKPPAPAAEPFRLGLPQQTTEPATGRSASKRAPVAGSEKPDPLRRVLSDALVAVYLVERGSPYGWDRVKDGQGLGRLLSWSRDVDEHVRRFRLALRSPAIEYGFRVDTIAAFATGRIWNHFAAPASGPVRPRPLAAPGGTP
jgi:hypothetical protein